MTQKQESALLDKAGRAVTRALQELGKAHYAYARLGLPVLAARTKEAHRMVDRTVRDAVEAYEETWHGDHSIAARRRARGEAS